MITTRRKKKFELLKMLVARGWINASQTSFSYHCANAFFIIHAIVFRIVTRPQLICFIIPYMQFAITCDKICLRYQTMAGKLHE